jgi:uncharacterized RDD family membrane protein YckC
MPAPASSEPPAIATSPIAPMSDRAIAAILDIIVMSAAFPVVGMWAAVRWGGVTSNGFALDGGPGFLVVVIVGAIGFLYLWLGEGLFGATLGKAAMRLRVRDLAGNRAGLGKSLLRNLLRIVDGIGVYLVGFIFALTSKTRQRLGDRVAGTVVVQVEAGLAPRLTAAIACVVLLGASLATAVALHAGAPASAATVPHVTRAELGTDNTPDYDIIGPTDTFASNQKNIVCVWRVEGVPSDVPIRSVWIAEDVGSAAPANTKIAEKSFAGADAGEFTLTPTSDGLPAGKYRLDIYIGDTLAKSLPFTITKS